jgi:hypothetical protein
VFAGFHGNKVRCGSVPVAPVSRKCRSFVKRKFTEPDESATRIVTSTTNPCL